MSGIGSLLTGVGGMWADTQSTKRTNNFNRRWDKNLLLWDQLKAHNQIQWRAEDAKKAGFHPLAALGISPSSSSISASVGVPPQFGQNLNRAGRALDNILSRKSRNLALEYQQEQLRGTKLDNDILELRKKELQNPPLPTLGPNPIDQSFGIPGQSPTVAMQDLGVTYKPVEIPFSKQPGIVSGITPMDRHSINQDGTVYKIPSEAVQEAIESDLFLAAKYAIGQTVDYLNSTRVGLLSTKKGKQRFANQMRKLRPKAPRGYEYRWNFTRGAFVLRKIKTGSHFYDHKRWSGIPYNAYKSKPRNIRGKFNYRRN